MSSQPEIVYVGGPTALITFHGLRFLTDPTFDPAGGDYVAGPTTLHKISDPQVSVDQLGPIDYILLSHDQHFDNLDHAGRKMLSRAKSVFTTAEGAKRLGGNAVGFVPWQTVEINTPEGYPLLITATPARHGPVGCEGRSGPVVGFAVRPKDDPTEGALYFSGDTVWYEGVAEVARWIPVSIAVLNMGAARVQAAGPAPLTMTADDAIQVAKAMPEATIVPLHFEGWAHFTESRQVIQEAFWNAGLDSRLRWVDPIRS
ncbi:MBL fold metallo-hydrolase [Edaphobacter sp. 12200R-103]|uniref:MBL fold metallo-hydrolase n=1 Tax=Edaphobacter sp. 12200R-103 TaxID=2703788 RepID=UPI00138C7D76|nr:MBL fold metallo-hydrolase [Edaphobacter sp. 12200R-103]QHS50549.1 MBL fold metallo-hydrolase [Edaphobacter sp. 12200R-103]